MAIDMGTVGGILSGLAHAKNIAQGILELKQGAEINAKVIDLQSAILAAQSSANSTDSFAFFGVMLSRRLQRW